jgi:hypothetical protein
MPNPGHKCKRRDPQRDLRAVKLVRGQRRVPRYPRVGEPDIILERVSWRLGTIFHELAHCVPGKLTVTLGPKFTACYLRLIHDYWKPDFACPKAIAANWRMAHAGD